MADDSLLGIFYAFLATAFLGSFWVISNFLVKSLPLSVITFYWFLSGSVTLFLIALFAYRKKLFLAKGKKLMALSGFFNVLATFFALYGISLVGGGATALLVQFMVVFSALLGFVFFGEKFSKVKAMGIGVVLVGATLMNFDKTLLISGGTFFGIISAFLYALAYLAAKKASFESIPFIVNTFRAVSATFFAFLILLFTNQLLVVPSTDQGFLIIVGSALTVVFGMTLFYKGLKKIKLAYASAIKINEASFALVYSFILAVNVPSIIVIFGGILVLAGSAVIALKSGS